MSQQHNAKFMGKVGKIRYIFHKYVVTFNNIYSYLSDIKWQPIEEVYLDNPPLEVGDKVYLAYLQVNVNIEEVVRSTDNSFIYYTDYVVEEIEDEETLRSKEEAEKQVQDYKNEIYGTKRNNQEKKWYQFWR